MLEHLKAGDSKECRRSSAGDFRPVDVEKLAAGLADAPAGVATEDVALGLWTTRHAPHIGFYP